MKKAQSFFVIITFPYFLQEREAAAEAAEEEGEGVVNDVPSKPKILTPVEAWENSLMSCTSYAQLYIHLTTLENSIIWSK